jgi:hypothetical protein
VALGFCECAIIQRSLRRQTIVGVLVIAGVKIKIEEEVISKILVSDTRLESGAKASDVEDYFNEDKEEGVTTMGSLSRS